VQEQPQEGNDDRREHRPAADQPHDRAPTLLVRELACDND
jgi:hypothetical protein